MRLLLLLCFVMLPLACRAAATSDEALTTIQLPNNPVGDALNYYEQLTGKRLIKDANLNGPPISIVVQEPIPKSEAIHLIEASLLLNGYSLIPEGTDAMKVILGSNGKNPRSEGAPLYATPADLPAGEQIVGYFMPLSYIAPSEAVAIFQNYIPVHTYGSYVPVANAQAVLLTENAGVIRQLIKVKQLIDVPPARVVTEFIKLKRANAEQITDTITKILESHRSHDNAPAGGEGSPNGPNEKSLIVGDAQLIPDARGSRILVITRPVNLPYIKDLIEQFDQGVPLSEPYERPLRYVSASDILPAIKALLSENPQDSDQMNGGASRRPQTPTTSTTSATPSPSAMSSTPGTTTGSDTADELHAPDNNSAPGFIAVGKTRIIADNKANSIIVFGSPEDAQKVSQIIDKLDKKPLQVYLATVIGQLTLTDSFETGIDVLQQYAGSSVNGAATGFRTRSGASDLVPLPNSLNNPGAFPLPSGLTLYGTVFKSLDIYVKALESTDRFKILSRPSVYTLNNQKAVISTGQQVPVPSSTLSTLNTGTDNTAAVNATIEYMDVSLKLEVIPLINADREVTLTVAQTNETLGGNETISGNTVPIINSEHLNTTVTVPDKNTIVLGGLVSDQTTRDTTGVPILSDIPIIGYLFRDTSRTKQRTELIIMIQPTVIASNSEMEKASENEQKQMNVGKETHDFSKTSQPTNDLYYNTPK